MILDLSFFALMWAVVDARLILIKVEDDSPGFSDSDVSDSGVIDDDAPSSDDGTWDYGPPVVSPMDEERVDEYEDVESSHRPLQLSSRNTMVYRHGGVFNRPPSGFMPNSIINVNTGMPSAGAADTPDSPAEDDEMAAKKAAKLNFENQKQPIRWGK